MDEHFFEIAYQQLPEELPTALSDFRTNLNEGLHTILLTLIEALEQGDPMDLTFVQQMTGNKSSLSALIHSKILKAHPNLSHKEQELLFTLTGRFERLSWLLGQLGKLARKHRFGQGSPQYRLSQAQQPAV